MTPPRNCSEPNNSPQGLLDETVRQEEPRVCHFVWKNSLLPRNWRVWGNVKDKGLMKKEDVALPKRTLSRGIIPFPLPRTITMCSQTAAPSEAISSPHHPNERCLFIFCFICSTPATWLSFLTLSLLSPSVPMVPISPGFHLFLLFPAETAVFPRALYLKEG